jgi:hypothetical protein
MTESKYFTNTMPNEQIEPLENIASTSSKPSLTRKQKIGRWGRRMAVAGLLTATVSCLYAIMPRDPEFYSHDKWVRTEESLPSAENQKKAAYLAGASVLTAIAGFAMGLYSIKGEYEGKNNQR